MSARADLHLLAERAAAGQLPDPPDPRWSRGLDRSTARRAAVLMLFGALDSVPAASPKPLAPTELDVLLVERAANLENHPGQVAFPGGGADASDTSVEGTALREAVEETGLDPDGVEILGALPEVALPVSNFLVTPVLGWWASQSPVAVVDFGESAQVFRVPVRDLLDPDNRYMATVRHGVETSRSPAFSVNGVVIWGFTGALLDRLFDQLGWAVQWDTNRLVPVPL
ncbi:CoA pyrophosphatase [Paenarthrobacter sp. Z7-10]|uniref:NUDIX hydrolase n=1 Tax=Paenarthrobacter sp. Z7-10 TaxID=2787635 RepID=UPI0022A8DB65|nr:CoA pyrophosphatase [Paenarthrobacter sp. Z7-10]MCZ2401804.1 CoA pyrophosphatase [Paenarthrobacter sp. Z7-10]